MMSGLDFGVFQRYRPTGNGVEELFSSVPQSGEYLRRLRELYVATSEVGCVEDVYFVIRKPRPTIDAELVALGLKLLSELRELATAMQHSELLETLKGITSVDVVTSEQFDAFADQNLLVHEVIGDAIGSFLDDEHPVVWMGEAYYSIACDYWIGWYLQWPYFRERFPGDPFRAYFELWLCGGEVSFQNNSLCLVRYPRSFRELI